MKEMQLILLTGGIGAGKSIVSRILRLKGFEVYDTDTEAKVIMDSNSELLSKIEQRWGKEVFKADGGLDRKEIASIVFNRTTERNWLNGIVHGLVLDDIRKRATTVDNVMFVESALPTTSGLSLMVDGIWLVEAPEEVRLQRACERDSSLKKAVESRIKAQEFEFNSLPDELTEIINNNGTSLLEQIENLIKKYNL